MIFTPRSMLLAVGLLALSVVGATAQQSNTSGAAGDTLKSTTPGNPNDARSSGSAATSTAGSTLKTETVGDTGKKVVPPTNSASTGSPAGTSTGPTGKQPQ